MGQVLHGGARTTEAVRRVIQQSQKSLNPMGPKEVRSTVLTKEEEAAIVAFRKYTRLPLDDSLCAFG